MGQEKATASESQVDEIAEEIQSLSLSAVQQTQEADPPTNWDPTLPYLTSILWDESALEFPSKYVYEPGVLADPKRGDDEQLYAVSLVKLESGAFAGEITGYIREETPALKKEKRLCFYYATHEGKRYFLSCHDAGNELRFVRQSDKEDANVRISRLWVDGIVRIFMEVIKDVQVGEEIICKPNLDALEGWSDRDSLVEQDVYLNTKELLWDQVQPDVTKAILRRRDLSEMAVIKIIELEGHPCKGQRGLYAARDLRDGTYLGEYTGRVVLYSSEVLKSKYLVDYSNPFEEGCDKIWIDAAFEGNETRYINDLRNTGREANTVMRRVWLAGSLRVFIQLTRDVAKGEEFLTDYGSGYWENLQDDNVEEEGQDEPQS
eukprot:TRINITY_DN17414_c0_g1_i1.p1 TRINITY_DN17414_c0_g1~~TRINITY_DN17414_c0_g1_i1.p1  ORF type:complete len:376 (+),score=91.24 TRINITY_DN17414_c0_g1_i1:68-1195(+)